MVTPRSSHPRPHPAPPWSRRPVVARLDVERAADSRDDLGTGVPGDPADHAPAGRLEVGLALALAAERRADLAAGRSVLRDPVSLADDPALAPDEVAEVAPPRGTQDRHVELRRGQADREHPASRPALERRRARRVGVPDPRLQGPRTRPPAHRLGSRRQHRPDRLHVSGRHGPAPQPPVEVRDTPGQQQTQRPVHRDEGGRQVATPGQVGRGPRDRRDPDAVDHGHELLGQGGPVHQQPRVLTVGLPRDGRVQERRGRVRVPLPVRVGRGVVAEGGRTVEGVRHSTHPGEARVERDRELLRRGRGGRHGVDAATQPQKDPGRDGPLELVARPPGSQHLVPRPGARAEEFDERREAVPCGAIGSHARTVAVTTAVTCADPRRPGTTRRAVCRAASPHCPDAGFHRRQPQHSGSQARPGGTA